MLHVKGHGCGFRLTSNWQLFAHRAHLAALVSTHGFWVDAKVMGGDVDLVNWVVRVLVWIGARLGVDNAFYC